MIVPAWSLSTPTQAPLRSLNPILDMRAAAPLASAVVARRRLLATGVATVERREHIVEHLAELLTVSSIIEPLDERLPLSHFVSPGALLISPPSCGR
ncbi:MAG: hypothetical protein PHQ28_00855 [Mycobacterium sp.]|nr:hypothetical protein [Mycobacterium sp.]